MPRNNVERILSCKICYLTFIHCAFIENLILFLYREVTNRESAPLVAQTQMYKGNAQRLIRRRYTLVGL